MKLGTTTLQVTKMRNGSYWTNVLGKATEINVSNPIHKNLNMIYRAYKSKDLTDYDKMVILNNNMKAIDAYFANITKVELKKEEAPKKEEKKVLDDSEKQRYIIGLNNLNCFFTEFDFTPNFRFINTCAFNNKSLSKLRSYVSNYFALTNSEFTQSIKEKMKAAEFEDELYYKFISTLSPSTKINNRFKVYYGEAGTGKTTTAMKEADGNVIACHSAMLPSDLMEDFDFEEGKAKFKKSALWRAMEEGKKIVFDEINLLPFESLRFLQTILDNKGEINYKGQKVTIKDGFKVIGTMNLKVDGVVFPLPGPLVDRAEEIVEYKASAEDLLSAII